MKRRDFLRGATLLGLFSTLLPARAAMEELTLPKVKTLLSKASPFATQILKEQGATPDLFTRNGGRVSVPRSDPGKWLEGKGRTNLVEGVDTMIHETVHGLSKRLVYQRSELKSAGPGSLIVMPDTYKRIPVTSTETEPSRVILDSLPANLRMTGRCRLYIGSTRQNLGTQVDGIYGLLDEFNAYHAGCRTSSDLTEYVVKRFPAKENEKYWIHDLSAFSGGVTAHQEFRGFILTYLAYSKEHQPKAYREVMENTGFRKAFRSIDRSFASLVDHYRKNLPIWVAGLNKQGIELDLRDNSLFRNGRGRGLQFNKYDALKMTIDGDSRLMSEYYKLR